ncbi:hypothetical protein E2C01_074778 [Portunus trituberculatus]|uniref:Uncharacterized protein n=1 Tax=Portunus trituberculatus TaxID=210409 RepID=A0A5B7IDA8_PORTR|nr:hypothetical protein [Portunus trituberculatus]
MNMEMRRGTEGRLKYRLALDNAFENTDNFHYKTSRGYLFLL